MRIAAVADIHGNLPALNAVLADVSSIAVDRVVFCGDMTLGAPDDRACYYRVKETGAPIIRGNAERYVAEFGTPAAEPRWTGEQFKPLQYAVSQFSDAERRELGNLPLTCVLPEAPDVLFYHANPRNDMDIWRSCTPDEELEPNYSGRSESVFVGGHNHTQQARRWRDKTIVICGSVGLTNDYFAGAQYVVLEKTGAEWRVEHREAQYDRADTLKRCVETDYVSKTGPIGRLMVRGIATGTNQMMPFLAWYRSGSMADELEVAVDKWLALY